MTQLSLHPPLSARPSTRLCVPLTLPAPRPCARQQAAARQLPPRALLRRLRLGGAAGMEDAALLALLDAGAAGPRQRRAQRIMSEVGSAHGLAQLGYAELCDLGLGRRTALRCLAALELGRRSSCRPPRGAHVDSPQEAHACMAPYLAHAPRERFVVLVLDARQRLQHVAQVGEGSVELCPVDVREVFAAGLKARGAGVVVGHNHPSGELTPSPADMRLTARLVQAGALLGLPVLDHLIICGARFVSMAALGLVAPEASPAATAPPSAAAAAAAAAAATEGVLPDLWRQRAAGR